ncbi:MAG TPA: AI-2E family transporter, partial [Candidatus Dormibacteraeota bacterium]
MPEQHQAATSAGIWRHQPVRILVYLSIALTVVMLFHQSEYLVVHIFNVLLLFVFAAIIALLLTPVIDAMEAAGVFKGHRIVAVLLLYIVIIAIIAAAIALVAPVLVDQAKQLPALEARVVAFGHAIQDLIHSAGIPLNLGLPSGPTGIPGGVITSAFGILTGTLGTLISLLLVFVISIYLLAEGRELIATLRKLVPGHEDMYDFILVALGTTFAQYARG